ncbi:MAG: hypothetical protein CVV34_01600 [Methanomicrobiales archaeon HGW-Methanomicrobiales-5]|nr:MAG: hypothetical protein CVV34_01600 [Methanomicrobiales archaeon HGW-Methanomicrobiales-5]
MKIHNIAMIPSLRASPRHGRARKFQYISVIDPPRGRPIGGGGVHHNYTKIIFKSDLKNQIFMGNPLNF